MLPIYLLSVVLNGLVGIILSLCKEETDAGAIALSLNNEKVRIIIGGLSLFTGILKILSPVHGNIPIIGDLVPALTGLGGGFILVFEFFRNMAPDSPIVDFLERVASLLGRHRKIAGFVCIGTAFIHFIFYPIPLL